MSTLKSYSFVNTFKILIVFNLYYITINSDSNGDIIVKNLWALQFDCSFMLF